MNEKMGRLTRRTLLGSAAAAVGSMTAAGRAAPAAMPLSRVRSEFLRFDDPADVFKQHFRMERDLVDREGSTLTWYHWTAFVIAEGRAPFPLMRYEGIEYSYFRVVAPLEYRIHAHNLSYVRDLTTGRFATTIENPITGRRVATRSTLLLNDPGTLASPRGFRNLAGDGKQYRQPYRLFRVEDNLVKLDSVRTAPPDWPVTHIENSCQWVDADLFENCTISSLPVHFAGSYVFPFLEWLEMGDAKGHMLGFFDGRKVNRPEDLPREFLERTERDHPELLEPRWGEFERPIKFLF
ncbi:MAG: hypothetical protein KDI32_07475 [Pseudomonadales bacterium]|nr:hypothetical protein [Pseudomonadales bacterium]